MQAPDITAGRGGLSALHNAAQYSHAATQAGNAATLSALQATKSIYDLWNTRREIGRQREQDKQNAERHDIEMEAARHKLDIAKANDQKQIDAGLALTKAQTGQANANASYTMQNKNAQELANYTSETDRMIILAQGVREGDPSKTAEFRKIAQKQGTYKYDPKTKKDNVLAIANGIMNSAENQNFYAKNNAPQATQATQAVQTPAQDFLATSNLVGQATPPSTQKAKTAFGVNDASKSPMARK